MLVSEPTFVFSLVAQEGAGGASVIGSKAGSNLIKMTSVKFINKNRKCTDVAVANHGRFRDFPEQVLGDH